MSHPCFKNDFDLLRHGPANRFETSPCVEIDTDASYPVTLTKRPPVPAVSGLTEHKHATRLSPAKEKGFNEIVELLPNPDRPEPNRCMMSSQKIEVGHTLKSKKCSSLFAFQPVRNRPRDIAPYYLSKPAAGFAQIIYVQLQFFDHLAHNFIAKGLNTERRSNHPTPRLPGGGLCGRDGVVVMGCRVGVLCRVTSRHVRGKGITSAKQSDSQYLESRSW
jgi:hypothetical protein